MIKVINWTIIQIGSGKQRLILGVVLEHVESVKIQLDNTKKGKRHRLTNK